MTAKTELMLDVYSKRFFVPMGGFELPGSMLNSRRLMLNLPLQSRFTALSACHRAAGESYQGT